MHRLIPFQPLDAVQLSADLRVHGRQIIVEYKLEDPQKLVANSLQAGDWPSWPRADDLWKTTCFELFLGHPGESSYWEFNFSPTHKKWNLYAFDDYRKPQPPTRSEDFELAMIRATQDTLKCELNAKIPVTHLEASLTAVIQTKQGISYFAVKHAGEKADFHRRDSFVIKI